MALPQVVNFSGTHQSLQTSRTIPLDCFHTCKDITGCV